MSKDEGLLEKAIYQQNTEYLSRTVKACKLEEPAHSVYSSLLLQIKRFCEVVSKRKEKLRGCPIHSVIFRFTSLDV